MNLQQILKKHPNMLYANEIAAICRPLEKLGITYFAHAVVDRKSQFAAISNHPQFTEHYVSNAYFNADIHMAKTNYIGSHCVWDAVDLRGRSADLYREGFEFNIRHTFTMVQVTENAHEFFHFATNKENPGMNQLYLSNLDLLNLFIFYFKDKISQAPALSRGYDLVCTLDKEEAAFEDNESLMTLSNQFIRDTFLEDVTANKKWIIEQGKSLSKLDIAILAWLHYGKTAGDVARLLNIAEVTVNKRLAVMKSKLQCYTQFQLGEQFSKSFSFSGDVIKRIIT